MSKAQSNTVPTMETLAAEGDVIRVIFTAVSADGGYLETRSTWLRASEVPSGKRNKVSHWATCCFISYAMRDVPKPDMHYRVEGVSVNGVYVEPD